MLFDPFYYRFCFGSQVLFSVYMYLCMYTSGSEIWSFVQTRLNNFDFYQVFNMQFKANWSSYFFENTSFNHYCNEVHMFGCSAAFGMLNPFIFQGHYKKQHNIMFFCFHDHYFAFWQSQIKKKNLLSLLLKYVTSFTNFTLECK